MDRLKETVIFYIQYNNQNSILFNILKYKRMLFLWDVIYFNRYNKQITGLEYTKINNEPGDIRMWYTLSYLVTDKENIVKSVLHKGILKDRYDYELIKPYTYKYLNPQELDFLNKTRQQIGKYTNATLAVLFKNMDCIKNIKESEPINMKLNTHDKELFKSILHFEI